MESGRTYLFVNWTTGLLVLRYYPPHVVVDVSVRLFSVEAVTSVTVAASTAESADC